MFSRISSNLLKSETVDRMCKSSHRWFSVKKSLHKNLAKFKGKHLCRSLFFNKVVGLRPTTLFKKRDPSTGVFQLILRKHFLQNASGRLLLDVFFSSIQQYKYFLRRKNVLGSRWYWRRACMCISRYKCSQKINERNYCKLKNVDICL